MNRLSDAALSERIEIATAAYQLGSKDRDERWLGRAVLLRLSRNPYVLEALQTTLEDSGSVTQRCGAVRILGYLARLAGPDLWNGCRAACLRELIEALRSDKNCFVRLAVVEQLAALDSDTALGALTIAKGSDAAAVVRDAASVVLKSTLRACVRAAS